MRQALRVSPALAAAGAAVLGGSGLWYYSRKERHDHTPGLATMGLELGPAVLFGVGYLAKTRPEIGVPLAVVSGFSGLTMGIFWMLFQDDLAAQAAQLSHELSENGRNDFPALTPDVEDKQEDKSHFVSILGYDVPALKLIYFVPVLVAPVAHILVTGASAQHSYAKARPYLIGAVLVTFGAVVQRLVLMDDAGIDSKGNYMKRREPPHANTAVPPNLPNA